MIAFWFLIASVQSGNAAIMVLSPEAPLWAKGIAVGVAVFLLLTCFNEMDNQ